MNNFNILDWDSAFFKFKVASVIPHSLNVVEIEEMTTQMKAEDVRLAYWKTPIQIDKFPSNTDVNLADVACLYSIGLPSERNIHPQISLYSGETISQELENIAIQCGIFSRFNLDKNFPSNSFEQLYRIWIQKSVSKEIADDILVYHENNILAGIVTVSVKNAVGNIGLFGIEESMRGRGIGKALLNAAISYFSDKNCMRSQVVTQSKNDAACGLYEKCGFTVIEKKYCYHFWL